MKIGYLCSDVDIPLYGSHGCSIHIRQFADALVEAGHDVFIICQWLGDPSRASTLARVYHLEPRGLDAHAWRLLEREPAIVENNLERDLKSVLFNSWLQDEGAAILERERPDFLYERYALFGWGGVQLSRRFGIPLIMELNAPLVEQQAGYEKFPLTGLAGGIEGEILRGADAIIALTDWLKRWAVGHGVAPEKIRVLPDGVNRRLFAAPTSGAAVRQRYGLEGKKVVGHVGSFHRWHDIAGLLEAFSTSYARAPELRLLLVGDGHERRAVQKKVADRGLAHAVVFTGNVPHDQVPEHLAAMDLSVVPYKQIQDFFFSPLKLFESMAVGTPTIAAALGQIEEVVAHGETGWLYPAGDNQKLAEGLAHLLGAPELRGRIGRAAREQVLSQYTWEAITAEVVTIARRLIERSSA